MGQKRNRIALIFSIISILIIILLLVFLFSFNNNLTGNVISTSVIADTATCEDADNGINPFAPGNVSYQGTTGWIVRSDYCVGNKLHEYYCKSSTGIDSYKKTVTTCDEGCLNGACIWKISCKWDGDNTLGNQQNSYKVYSKVKLSDNSYIYDFCTPEDPAHKVLIEYGCDAGNITVDLYRCNNKCSNGRCV